MTKPFRLFGLALAIGSLWPVAVQAQAAGSSSSAGSPPVTEKPVSASPSEAESQRFAIHAQATFVVQGNPRFRAAFEGANSLHSGGETRETADVTVYAGVKPWSGGELWINPEVDQGFGLANTLGAAGFPSAEAYKVGKANPYLRLQRLSFGRRSAWAVRTRTLTPI